MKMWEGSRRKEERPATLPSEFWNPHPEEPHTFPTNARFVAREQYRQKRRCATLLSLIVSA